MVKAMKQRQRPHDKGRENERKLGALIREARQIAGGLTLEELAAKVPGYDAANLSRFERGKQSMPTDKLEVVLDALGIDPTDLFARIMGPGVSDVRVYPLRRVPLISWVQAGLWSTASDPYEPGDAHEWVDVYAPVSDHTFALSVRGDSMTNPTGNPTFPEGTIIIVDPAVDAQTGHYVVAKLEGDEEVTFKRLYREGSRVWLVALNPKYDPLPVDRPMKICGVVVAKAYEPLL